MKTFFFFLLILAFFLYLFIKENKDYKKDYSISTLNQVFNIIYSLKYGRWDSQSTKNYFLRLIPNLQIKFNYLLSNK